MLYIATTGWVLYVLAQGGWQPMGDASEFSTKAACVAKLEWTQRNFSSQNIPQVQMRCREPGWKGESVDDIEL